MRYVKYGKTRKTFFAVEFGGLRFDLSKSNEENVKLVTYAYDKGINYFDTAACYCDGRSKKILGVAFRQLKKRRKN